MRRLPGGLVLLPLVALAALRVAWFYPRLPLDELVRRLGAVPPLPRFLRAPETLLGTVNLWLRWLPPRSLRACLRRSLILVDLWSRCGLPVELHLGVALGGGTPEGHAWVTTGSTSSGTEEAARFEPAVTLATGGSL